MLGANVDDKDANYAAVRYQFKAPRQQDLDRCSKRLEVYLEFNVIIYTHSSFSTRLGDGYHGGEGSRQCLGAAAYCLQIKLFNALSLIHCTISLRSFVLNVEVSSLKDGHDRGRILIVSNLS
jgi:hypothetical protein